VKPRPPSLKRLERNVKASFKKSGLPYEDDNSLDICCVRDEVWHTRSDGE
jgi:hypothetical protein